MRKGRTKTAKVFKVLERSQPAVFENLQKPNIPISIHCNLINIYILEQGTEDLIVLRSDNNTLVEFSPLQYPGYISCCTAVQLYIKLSELLTNKTFDLK